MNYKTCCWVSQVIIWNNTSYYFWCFELQQSSARWVPRMLTAEIMHVCMQTSSRNLDLYLADPVKFLCRYVTTDETCAHHFDSEKKRQSTQPYLQWSSFENHICHKVMASVFWNREGVFIISWLSRAGLTSMPWHGAPPVQGSAVGSTIFLYLNPNSKCWALHHISHGKLVPPRGGVGAGPGLGPILGLRRPLSVPSISCVCRFHDLQKLQKLTRTFYIQRLFLQSGML